MNVNPNIDSAKDGIESSIILALYSKGKAKSGVKVEKFEKGWARYTYGLEIFCPKKTESPKEMFAYDANSAERLYTCSLDHLVVDPEIAIGRGIEVALLCEDGSFKWTKVMPMPAPRGLVAMTNKKPRWFAYHFRHIMPNLKGEYIVRPIALVDGAPVLLKPLGMHGFDAQADKDEMTEQLAITLSIFEDAIRSNCMMATVEEHAKLIFPIDQSAYKDFFAIRDGYKNTPTGKRNPILHWCSKHIRSRAGKVFEVTGHQKGAEQMVHGNMKLTIEPGPGYQQYIKC